MTQSSVAIGHLGVRRDDPDYYPLEILNQVLSGSFSSRLFSHVRTQKGLAYSVAGQVGSDWDHPGMTFLYVSTKTQTTGAGIQALLDEARAVQTTQPPTEEEVEKARQSLLNSFIFNADTPRKVLGQQLSLELYGYPLDWLSRYRAGLEAVTPAQVRDAAIRHLHPDDFAVLVVGPAEGRDRPLTDFGKVTNVDLAIPGKGKK
jgi:zinc protease